MERKKNHSLKENKQVNKENTYIGSIVTLVFSIVFAFVVLVSIQAIMGDKTVTIANNKAEQYYYDGKFDDAINEYMSMQNNDSWPIWTAKAAEIYSGHGRNPAGRPAGKPARGQAHRPWRQPAQINNRSEQIRFCTESLRHKSYAAEIFL